jgi:hypothetical protein
MAQTPAQPPAGDDRNLVTVDNTYLAPSLEDRISLFWENNRSAIVTGCVLALLAVAGYHGWQWFMARKNAQIVAAYAAATDTAGRRAFATTYPQAPLAGVAHLELADEALKASKYTEARADYAAAAARLLPADPFLGGRARLGEAFAALQAGETAAAETVLEAITAATQFAPPHRAEAAYHLASLARDAKAWANVTKWADQALAFEPTGIWAQNGLRLKAQVPAEVAPAPAAAAQ